ncbi:hypothetical protein LZF95_26735 [Algoriphagus sp. AGSA1]|uniref:hypothetical protein n=1 Tax=Algoriphagus sp. AGSA1 TaxID=2907213 RepID=UPI001F34EA62|nr:hypothetical protein [Algoriphagus sp. AGSA1]MCE7058302.1 hypothetical protein [Algoriphagus sp. AGSA1]
MQTWQVFLFQMKTVCALNLPGFSVGSKKYTAVSTIPKDTNLAGFSVPNENRVCAKPARFFCWGKKYTAVSTIPKDTNLAGFYVPNENRVCAKPARFSCWE